MRPNWFLGFPLDGSFIRDLPPPPPCLRLFDPADVHMTLAFLGPCGDAGAAQALYTLDELMREQSVAAFDISLGEVVAMGRSRRDYSALSALLELGRDQAIRHISRLRDVLTGRVDKRPPKPHVTVARPMRRATQAQRDEGRRWAAALDLSHVCARLDRIALYTWSDDRPRTQFRIVEERYCAEHARERGSPR